MLQTKMFIGAGWRERLPIIGSPSHVCVREPVIATLGVGNAQPNQRGGLIAAVEEQEQ